MITKIIFQSLLIAVCVSTLRADSEDIAKLLNYRYYPRFHLAPEEGWMNDPNGFCVYKGVFELFYQFNPVSSLNPGTARWGHARSKDLFTWENRGIAIQNNSYYDINGVFSGSAVVESDVMYIFYTGQVKHPNQTPNQTETLELVTSYDAVTFTKYENNPVMTGEQFQPNFRDPKVWLHEGIYWVVLGNSFIGEDNQQLGRVLLFNSTDRINWNQVSIIGQSNGTLGYMWECPDFFELNGHFVFLFSPQGVKRQGNNFWNLYQTGYIIGDFEYDTGEFTPLTEFRELDHGHDFYATQTTLDDNGRRLLVAWLDMWETSYPEAEDGFTGQMTIVRELSLTDDYQLLQTPVKEVVSVRDQELYNGYAGNDTLVTLSNKAGEVYIEASNEQDFILYIGTNTTSVQIKYDYLEGLVSLKRDDTDNGLRRTSYSPTTALIMRVFIDASSIEVFFGEGEVVFSSRYFIDDSISVWLDESCEAAVFIAYDMKTTLYANQE